MDIQENKLSPRKGSITAVGFVLPRFTSQAVAILVATLLGGVPLALNLLYCWQAVTRKDWHVLMSLPAGPYTFLYAHTDVMYGTYPNIYTYGLT